MKAAFQTAEHGGPFRNKERGRGRQLAPIVFRSVMIRARENLIRRYSLTGLNRSRYFALAGRNCFSAFFGFRAISNNKSSRRWSEAGRFFREERESAKCGSLFVNRDRRKQHSRK